MIKGVKVVAVTLVLVLLAGCSPEFRTPVAWGGGKLIGRGPIVKDPMRVELYDGGVGYVENLPRGVSEKVKAGYICTRVTSEERYTGEISWRIENKHTIEVEFEDSKYFIGDGPGKFDSQSWDELNFAPCGEDAGFWQLGVSCGFVGEPFEVYGLPDCPARE